MYFYATLGKLSSLLFSIIVSNKLLVTFEKLKGPKVDNIYLYSDLFKETLLKNY